MIDFARLDKLVASARDPHKGKPLDTVRSLHGALGRGSLMRNCRLYKVNDTNWRVSLHNNLIATITKLDNGSASVRISSVESWPTMTTAERLSSVLGFAIWKQDNKLRGNFKNVHNTNSDGSRRSYRQYPPLVNDQTFLVNPMGAFCTNPEIVKEKRIRVISERAKPVLAYLRSVKKLGVTMARLEAVSYVEVESMRAQMVRDGLYPMSLDTEVSTDLLLRVFTKGVFIKRAPWWVRQNANNNAPCGSDNLAEFLASGLRHYKDALYSHHGVYETYDYSFMGYFTETNHGHHEPLALAA